MDSLYIIQFIFQFLVQFLVIELIPPRQKERLELSLFANPFSVAQGIIYVGVIEIQN